jgi:hypothetical protein
MNVFQGRRRYLRRHRESALHGSQPRPVGADLVRLQIHALCSTGLHEWRGRLAVNLTKPNLT